MIENRVALAVYFMLAVVLMFPLLGPGYYLALDMQWGPASFKYLLDFYGYMPSPYGAYLPLKMVFSGLSEFLSGDVVQKILLTALLFLAGFCTHTALPKELGNARYFGGFLYVLNPFMYIRFLAGHWTLLLSYALWPIAIKMFIDFLRKPDDNRLLANVALITFAASISSHGVLMLFIPYALIFILHSVMNSPKLQLLLKRTAVLGMLVLFMNLFWIAPSLLQLNENTYSTASAEAYLMDFGTQSEDMPLATSILTMHGFWRGGFLYTKDTFDLWYIPFIGILLLTLFGLFRMLKNERLMAVFLASLFIISLLFASNSLLGAMTALSSLTGGRLPFHFFFRDTQKFVGLLALSYAFLGTYGVHYLGQRLEGMKKKALTIFLVGLVAICNFSFFGFLEQVGNSYYPDDWKEAERIMSADTANSRILILPPHLYAKYPWVNSQQQTLGHPAAQMFLKGTLVPLNIETENIYSDWQDPQGSYLRYILDRRSQMNNTAEALVPLNVGYIVLFKYSVEHLHYLNLFYQMETVPDIELVYDGPHLSLFRNNVPTEVFFASKENGSGSPIELLNLSKEGSYSANVSYRMITPATYYIEDCPYDYLVFLASYTYPSIEFNGQTGKPWHYMGHVFEYTGPGMLVNKMFYLVLFLFLSAWLLAAVLLAGANYRESAAMLASAVVIYILTFNGILTPPMLGLMILATVPAALYLRSKKKDDEWFSLPSIRLPGIKFLFLLLLMSPLVLAEDSLPFDVDLQSGCSGNVITATVAGEPLTEAWITVFAGTEAPIYSSDTDANGQIHFEGCDYRIIVVLSKPYKGTLLSHAVSGYLINCSVCGMESPSQERQAEGLSYSLSAREDQLQEPPPPPNCLFVSFLLVIPLFFVWYYGRKKEG